MSFLRRLSLVLFLPTAVLLLAGCHKEEPVISADTTQTKTAVSAIPAKPVPSFNGDQAMADVIKQVDFGPRVPNTAPHQKELEWLRKTLADLTDTNNIQLQHFTAQGYNGPLDLTNVIASFNPQATERILILTHWDSRPWADEDPNKANHDKPVPAANDGASGTAVMLELARQFKQSPPPIGVDLLFDDGEDYGKYDVDSLDRYFLGVKYFVNHRPSNYHPFFAILLDMVGDKNANFTMEGYSSSDPNTQPFTAEIWRTANSMGLSHFKMQQGPTISDDHTPLLAAGVPTVDIIDGDLVGHQSSDPNRKYWHTTDDLPSHVSPETMSEVGRLLLTLIYQRLPKDIPVL